MSRPSRGRSNLIDFSTKSLLTSTPSSTAPAQATRPAPSPATTTGRPFAAASSVQAYLASLQAKVKGGEKKESSDESTLSISSDGTVVDRPQPSRKPTAVVSKPTMGTTKATEAAQLPAKSSVELRERRRSSSTGPLVQEITPDAKPLVRQPQKPIESDSESSSGSISTIFNVRSLSEIASESSEPAVPTESSDHDLRPQASAPNRVQARPILPALKTPAPSSSGSSENIRSFGSLDVPTEIEQTDKETESIKSIDSDQPTSDHASTIRSVEDFHTATEDESKIDSVSDQQTAYRINQSSPSSGSVSDQEYESDFEDDQVQSDSEVPRPSATKSKRPSRAETTAVARRRSRQSVKVDRSEMAVQKTRSVERSVQTDSYPHAYLSVAEYFHPAATETGGSAAYKATVALGNYHNAVHPASAQNRLIVSVLEAHLHCIRTFAEGQRAIYDHWNDILSDHKASTARRRHRSMKKLTK